MQKHVPFSLILCSAASMILYILLQALQCIGHRQHDYSILIDDAKTQKGILTQAETEEIIISRQVMEQRQIAQVLVFFSLCLANYSQHEQTTRNSFTYLHITCHICLLYCINLPNSSHSNSPKITQGFIMPYAIHFPTTKTTGLGI